MACEFCRVSLRRNEQDARADTRAYRRPAGLGAFDRAGKAGVAGFGGTEVGSGCGTVLFCIEGIRRFSGFRPGARGIADKLFQGPIADALTHVGQIAMLRRMAGAPVKGESYFAAEIVAGRVGREQTVPKREFD
jgi:hypothetical protein